MFILYLYFWNKISSLCTNKWRVWCVIFFWKLLNRPLVMLACPSNIKEKSISNPNSRSLLVWEFGTESLEGTRDKYQSMIRSCDMICLVSYPNFWPKMSLTRAVWPYIHTQFDLIDLWFSVEKFGREVF